MSEAATQNDGDELSQAELEFEKAKGIVEPMSRSGKGDNEIVIALITAGFGFKKAGRLLGKVLEALGVRLSNTDRLKMVSEMLMKNDFAPKDWTEVVQVCEYLAEELDATSEKQAMVSVKKFAKNQSIVLPEKPKNKGLRAKTLEWSRANPTADDEAFKVFVSTVTDKESQKNTYARVHGYIRDAYAAGVASTREAV